MRDTIAKYISGIVGLRGATDNTRIGNSSDSLKVSVTNGGVPVVDALRILPIGFGGLFTAPLFPAVKIIGVYKVPAGKTLKIYGLYAKASATTTFCQVLRRKLLWKQNGTALAAPATPTTVVKTVANAGMAPGVYSYKTVAVNIMGKTLPSLASANITLTAPSNAVTLTQTALVGALYYEVYRTTANGSVHYYVGTTDGPTFVDIYSDAELVTTNTPPVTNTTAGSVAVDSYETEMGSSMVVVDTLTALAADAPLDIIYKDQSGNKRHLAVTALKTAGVQTGLPFHGNANTLTDNRISPTQSAVGVQQVLSVGNPPTSGSIAIYGYKPVALGSPTVANAMTLIPLPFVATLNPGEELCFALSGGAAITAAIRHDIQLIGELV